MSAGNLGDFLNPLNYKSGEVGVLSPTSYYDSINQNQAAVSGSPSSMFFQSTSQPSQSVLGTTFDSQTPASVNSAKPDFFSQIFSGLANNLGQAGNAFLNTAATNLANRVTAGPTVKSKTSQTQTTAGVVSSGKILGLSYGTWALIAIGGIAIVFLLKK